MGLDWNPGPKPKPGFEDEFRDLFEQIEADPGPSAPSPRGSMFGGLLRALGIGGGDPETPKRPSKEALLARMKEVSTTPFETLEAPQVGFHPAADEWARKRFATGSVNMSMERWMARMKGYYVLDAVEPCDGLPRYTNGQPGGYVEAFSFRADFLKDCEDIVGDELLAAAFESKLADPLIAFGDGLLAKANAYADEKGIDLESIDGERLLADTRLRLQAAGDERAPEPVAEDLLKMDELRLDIVLSAGRWCRFWGARGHLMEAYW